MPATMCPGALPHEGPMAPEDLRVVCGPLALDRDKEDDGAERGDQETVVLTVYEDLGTVLGYCCGRYSECVIWRAEKHRIWDLREHLESDEDADRRAFIKAEKAKTLVPGGA